MKSASERFEEKIERVPWSGCWVWMGAQKNKLYGSFQINRRSMSAHRMAWILYRGAIPQAMCVCHTCDNGLCVNPDHLWLGTYADNHADMDRKGRRITVRGVDSPRARFTEQQILDIRASSKTTKGLARQFGVNPIAIRRIRQNRTWVHLLRERQTAKPPRGANQKAAGSVNQRALVALIKRLRER